MSWAEIKTTLNSTLGTADYKPLDEIILEALEELNYSYTNGKED